VLGSLFLNRNSGNGTPAKAQPTTQFSTRGRRGASDGRGTASDPTRADGLNVEGPARGGAASSLSASPPEEKASGVPSSNLSAAPTPRPAPTRLNEEIGRASTVSTAYGPQVDTVSNMPVSGVLQVAIDLKSMDNMDSEELMMALSAMQGSRIASQAPISGRAGGSDPASIHPPELWEGFRGEAGNVGETSDPLGATGIPGGHRGGGGFETKAPGNDGPSRGVWVKGRVGPGGTI